ncbi:unnamed protein product [Brassica oleracea var. botrytis]
MVRTTLSKTTSNIFFYKNRKIQLPPLISGYVSHRIAPESSSNGPTKSTATPEEEERSSPRSSAYTNMITTTMTPSSEHGFRFETILYDGSSSSRPVAFFFVLASEPRYLCSNNNKAESSSSSSSTYLASAATLLRLRLKAALVSSLLLWMWRLFLQRTQCSIPQRKGSLRAR